MPFRPIIGCVVVGEAVTSDFNPVRPEGGGGAGVGGRGGGSWAGKSARAGFNHRERPCYLSTTTKFCHSN